MPPPKTLHLRFYECEHHGDLNNYLQDLGRCGARVLDHRLDEDAEEAVVRIEIPDFPAFKEAWQQTDAADFADSIDWYGEPDA